MTAPAFPTVPAALGIAPREPVMTAVPRGRFAGVGPALDRPLDPAGSRLAQTLLKAAGRAGLKSPPGLYVCDTELVPGPLSFLASRPCEAVPAFPFAAVCACELRDGRGHLIRGYACRTCLDSAGRGCLTCWLKPGRRRNRHECPVTLYAPGRPP